VTEDRATGELDRTDKGNAEVWLIRHGETEWALNGRHTGTTDIPLTPNGEVIAAALADRLRGVTFDLVLSSPLQRARRTAELAGFPDAQIEPDLVEWNYGDYEGRTSADIHQERPGWSIWTDGGPDGETPEQISARVDRVIDRCRENGGRSLLFAHGHVLRTLAARWVEQPVTLGAHLPLGTGRVCVLADDRGIPTLDRWNAEH
jgi:probable phosphoglycerate mutase